MNLFKNKTLLIKLCIFLICATIIFTTFTIIQSKTSKIEINSTNSVIESVYPEDVSTDPFSLPPLGPDPNTMMIKDDQSIQDRITDYNNNPNSNGIRTTVYPLPQMRALQTTSNITTNINNSIPTVWLNEDTPFQGLWLIEPYFPASQKEEEIGLKVLIDDQESNFTINNESSSTFYVSHHQRGERKLLNINTKPIPKGIHTLRFLLFRAIDDNNSNPSVQYNLGLNLPGSYFKAFVATTNNNKVEFTDWSTGPTPLPKIGNLFNISNGSLDSEGFPLWKPPLFKPSERVEYKWTLNNPSDKDREFCIIALLDYEQIPIETGKSRFCGIVRAGQIAQYNTYFSTPVSLRNHHLQLLSFENPLMKKSYNAQVKIDRLGGIASSSRVLLTVQS